MIGKVIKYSTLGIYALCGLALLVFMLPATGLKAKSVATGSMQPAIPVGSLAIIQRVPLSKIAVGDVVTYRKSASTTITHRVIKTERRSGIPYYITKGDANTSPDPAIPGGAIVGKVRGSIPYLGTLIDWVKTPLGLALIVIIPGLIVIIDESRRLHRALAPQPLQSSTPQQPDTTTSAPAATPKPRPRTRRSIDGMSVHKLTPLLIFVIITVTGTTLASLQTNKVTLANNSLTLLLPHTKDDCKKDGWKNYGFKNQGQCVSFFNH